MRPSLMLRNGEADFREGGHLADVAQSEELEG